MEFPASFLVVSLLLSCFAATGYGVTFSSLQKTLVVTTSPTHGQVDLLKKDKTCQHKIVAKPYSASNNSFTWTIVRDIPSAMYFVRAYAINAQDEEVGFGQTTNHQKDSNLFEIQAITGRHVSLDIASICFSAFSIVALAGF
ncbi:hypothetical protein L1887_35288 [Cichorium endivia]|nr:hypothetical protein L1887_35288 [Cichorium endivia]